jgi:chaperone modulatory protein CbpM
MKPQVSDSIWLNDVEVCTIEQLAEVSGLAIEELTDLIECGVIVPVDHSVQPQQFFLHTIATVKTARRLRDDFQLDRYGVALALTLLRRIDELDARIQAAEKTARDSFDEPD